MMKLCLQLQNKQTNLLKFSLETEVLVENFILTSLGSDHVMKNHPDKFLLQSKSLGALILKKPFLVEKTLKELLDWHIRRLRRRT